MKLIKKVAAGFLFTWTFMCGAIVVDELLDTDNTAVARQEASDMILAAIVLGLPSAAGGGWLVRSLIKQERDRLHAIFYNLLKTGNGSITVLQLAMEAQIPGNLARKFLDEKVKEFHGNFDITHSGDVYYYFNIGKLDSRQISASGRSGFSPPPEPKPRKSKGKKKIK